MVAKLACKNKDGDCPLSTRSNLRSLLMCSCAANQLRQQKKEKATDDVSPLEHLPVSGMDYCRSALEITILWISEVPS
jgi:hypothetical protein